MFIAKKLIWPMDSLCVTDGITMLRGKGARAKEKEKVHDSHAERWTIERRSARTKAREKAKKAKARKDRQDGAQDKRPARRRGHALGVEARPTC